MMLKDSLYLYALLLFCFTAIEAVETCPDSRDTSIARGKCSTSSNYPTNEEASAFFALVEDDNEELDEISEDQFLSCKQDENNPKDLNKNNRSFACGEDEEEEFISLPLT